MDNEKGIEDEVLRVISITLDIPKSDLDINSTMKNVRGWDSLGHLNIVTAMEELLEIQLTLDELAIISSVKDWVEIFIKHRSMG